MTTKIKVSRNLPIIFVIGLSGTGKSTLGKYVEADLNFLYIEQDIPKEDGIEKAGFRDVWGKYLNHHDVSPLAEELREMARHKQKKGIIITFDSFAAFSSDDIACAKKSGIITVLLDGSDEDCSNSFVVREKSLNTGRDKKCWLEFNAKSSYKFQKSEYDPYRIPAFENHKHVPLENLIEHIKMKIRNPLKMREVCS